MAIMKGEKAMLDYEVKRRICTLSENPKTHWTRELNYISWNGMPPKFDIREFSPDHKKLSKGVTLTEEEMSRIKDAILCGMI